MPIEADLLPCPFCGEPATLTNVRMSNHTFIVGCYNETCVRPRTDGFGAKEDVIRLWNARPIAAVRAEAAPHQDADEKRVITNDLLKALKALHIDANRLCDRQLGGSYEDDCRRAIAVADAAIAKAEGK